MKKNIEIHLVDLSTSLPLPYADEGIRAGLPSPAQYYIEQSINNINGKNGRTRSRYRLEA